MLAQKLERVLVKAVYIGPLLAVDLDVDEQFVHQRRCFRILEAFMGHDVAPVAGCVADRDHHRPA